MSSIEMPRFIEGQELWSEFDGQRMRYLKVPSQQPTAMPAVVFIHGLLAYSYSWRHNLKEFSRTRDAYAVDMLGLGYSDRPARGTFSFSLTDTARRMLGWLESLGLRGIDLVGTSHGGALAMVMAAIDKRERRGIIRRLVLVAPANPYSKRGRKRLWFFNTQLGELVLRVSGGGKGGVSAWALGRMYADRKKLTRETKNGYSLGIQRPGTLDYAMAIIRGWKQDMQDLTAALDEIRDVPTLLLWGRKDPTVPASSARPLAKHFSKAKLVMMPGSGHLPYEEEPELFNHEVLAFLNAEEPWAEDDERLAI